MEVEISCSAQCTLALAEDTRKKSGRNSLELLVTEVTYISYSQGPTKACSVVEGEGAAKDIVTF